MSIAAPRTAAEVGAVVSPTNITLLSFPSGREARKKPEREVRGREGGRFKDAPPRSP